MLFLHVATAIHVSFESFIPVCPVCGTQCWPQCQNPWWKLYFPWHGNDCYCNSWNQEYQPNSQSEHYIQGYCCCGKSSSLLSQGRKVGMTAVIFEKKYTISKLKNLQLSWYLQNDFYFQVQEWKGSSLFDRFWLKIFVFYLFLHFSTLWGEMFMHQAFTCLQASRLGAAQVRLISSFKEICERLLTFKLSLPQTK